MVAFQSQETAKGSSHLEIFLLPWARSMTTPQLPQNQGQEQKGLEVQTLEHQVWKLLLNCLNVKDMDH